ncbi:MAG TPA: aryl-sulfate sulfotransferase [Puia sp.]
MNRRIMILAVLISGAVLNGCSGRGDVVREIGIGLHANNELKIEVDVATNANVRVFAEYWPDSNSSQRYVSTVSNDGLKHALVLGNILPQTGYSFRVVTESEGVRNESKVYAFRSRALPMWLQDQFKYSCNQPELLPGSFKEGFMLMNKREAPGLLYIVDTKGRLRWYHMVDGTGVKVAHFTADRTILSILGTSAEPTSYGSEILEVNLLGDTLLHLKKGQGDLRYTIHHEVIKNTAGDVVTIYEDPHVMDLRAVGGGKADTVNGDGILVLDRNGRKVWQWSVFDVCDPFADHALLKHKKDWMHANSLSFDVDSNYLVSFYNLGQVWKVDARSGKVLWKMGKGGTLRMPATDNFSQSHAVHINPSGSLMLFDNGVDRNQSGVYAYRIDSVTKAVAVDWHIDLPKEIYNDRMGSAYMIGDSLVLCCCSKRHITVLVNKKGQIVWTLDTAIPPYRVEFIPAEKLKPYILH